MKTKSISILSLLAAATVATWMIWKPAPPRESAAPKIAQNFPAPAAVLPPPVEPRELSDLPAPSPNVLPTPPPAAIPVSPAARSSKISGAAPVQTGNPPKPARASGKKPQPPVHDPTARFAMSFVGADADAEAYWLEAIFDSSLPDGEREDLMEDLNEEGLSDHKRPGPQDFPLILNRLALIEKIAPEADEFMLPHLWEAYKDLVNLAHITQGEGRPVR